MRTFCSGGSSEAFRAVCGVRCRSDSLIIALTCGIRLHESTGVRGFSPRSFG